MASFGPGQTQSAGGFFIGLMSGTSLDGVDGVLAEFSATGRVKALLAHEHVAFDEGLREAFMALQAAGDNELHRAALAGNALAAVYAEVVEALLAAARVDRESVVCIAAHGQTVRHRPDLGYTWQLNNPSLLAELTAIPVIADFRSRDIAAGGEGAPLVPAFHRAMFAKEGRTRAVVNLGGICNMTLIDGLQGLVGYDIGPANVLLDLWAAEHLGEPFDRNGAWASIGETDPELLDALLDEPYFCADPPKSTGRDLFDRAWLERHLEAFRHLSPEDVQRTLVELTAVLIADALEGQQTAVGEVLLCGGGALNATLRDAIALQLARFDKPPKLSLTGDCGVEPTQVEALAFAWLGFMHVNDMPANHPDVTGADDFRVLGAYYPH